MEKQEKFSFHFYYIVNLGIILIRNINLMLKFTGYPHFFVDNLYLSHNKK